MPQSLQGADILATSAAEEYQVFIPDFFEGSPADIAWYPPETEEQKKALYGWFPARMPPMGAEKIPGILKSIEEVYGKKTWGAVGYCWGGKVLSITSGEGTPFKAVAQTSPASKFFLSFFLGSFWRKYHQHVKFVSESVSCNAAFC